MTTVRRPADVRAGVPRGGRGSGDRLMVPEAELRSYYGKPIVKAPVWTYNIPAYLFTGGLAAGSALLAAGGDLTDRPALRRAGRFSALAAIGVSGYLLIRDLGRPARFHHMLRVAKPTSPMSMGTWILAGFGPVAGLAAAGELAAYLPARGPLGLARAVLPPAARVGGLAAAGLAPALATYTAVLLADTAVPSWHEAYPHLPFVFAGSALASASGVGMLAAPPAQAGPARRLAVVGGAIDLAATYRVECGLGLVSEPYRTGRAGRLLRLGRTLTALGAVSALLSKRHRVFSLLSGGALLAGGLATRFGIFEAGAASARDPKYTVAPQLGRLPGRAPAGSQVHETGD